MTVLTSFADKGNPKETCKSEITSYNKLNENKEASFLTNCPVVASTLNSPRPICADFKCMVSIIQAFIRYSSGLAI